MTLPAQPPAPAAGQPCWTDTSPYPFGADGNPYTPGSSVGPLQVQSLAFRAWNRGLAAVQALNGVPYTVWLFNGTRWYPDATFPGPSACSGQTILWAGKLDYWLIGGQSNAAAGTSGVCRFDGVNFQWEPQAIPAASLARAPSGFSFVLHSGACYAWNDCWFFGDYGVVDHWDGQSLTDASPGLGSSPWLAGRYTAAAGGLDAAGNPFGLAVTEPSAKDGGSTLPAQPDGAPAPQIYSSTGGAFSPLAQNPLVASGGSSALATDLVAVAADAKGGGWVAGDPVGVRPHASSVEPPTPAGPSPLFPVSAGAEPPSCGGYGTGDFTFDPGASQPAYLWQTVSMFPDGAALAGGQYGPDGSDPNGPRDPVLVTARCGQPPVTLRFRDPNAPSAPADLNGYVTAVTANAGNDAWAATTGGAGQNQAPHLYRLSDGQPPDAPAGDDNEIRPLVFTIDPPIYVQSPGVIPPAAPTVTQITQSRNVTRRVHEKAAIYEVKAGTPKVGRRGRITLTISFRVRRPVTIGLEALRRGRVVSRSGLHRFRGGTGRLSLVLDRKRWPTRLKFVTPKSAKGATDLAGGPVELTWTARLPA